VFLRDNICSRTSLSGERGYLRRAWREVKS
jgi:hypothetical protein